MLKKIETKTLDYARLLSRALRAIRCANVRAGILPPQARLRGNDEPRRDGRRVSDPIAAGKWMLMLRKIETRTLDHARLTVARPFGPFAARMFAPAYSAVPPSRE